MGIDDLTTRDGSMCGNFVGMCCSQKVMVQDEILERTRDAYGVEGDLPWERLTTRVMTQVSAFSTDDYFRESNAHTVPLLDTDKS